MLLTYVLLAAGEEVFGTVSAPPGVADFADGPSGLIVFISNLIKLITVGAGIFGLFNIIAAGYTYLGSSGNPKATEQAVQQLVNSGIGLAIIVASFAITSLVSFLLFGDAMYILNPDIPGPTTQ